MKKESLILLKISCFSIYAESTPNPSVMKFVANKPLVTHSVEFKNIDEAKKASLSHRTVFNLRMA